MNRPLLGGRVVLAVAVYVVTCIAAGWPSSASAGTFEVDACSPYTTTSGVFQHAAVFGIGTYLDCPPGGGAGIYLQTGPNTVPAGTTGRWYAQAPSGLTITEVVIPSMVSFGVDDGTGWGGGFWWPGGGVEVADSEGTFIQSQLNTSYFEFEIVCGWSTCNGATHPAIIEIRSIQLMVQETGSPSITPTSPLYSQTGWIRGNGWPLSFQADDPSGVCQDWATVGSTLLKGDAPVKDPTVWHQCPAASFSQRVSTTGYPNGPLSIGLDATNAAGNLASRSRTVYVDNVPVGMNLSGPTDEPSTAGTQYITASATAGPSGVSGIGCTVDGAPYRWYPESTVKIPVAGLGVHKVTCYGANNAKDASGHVATSAPHTWTLRIGEPTVMGIAFTRMADAMRCRKVRAHARGKKGKVMRCHPRTERKKVTTWRTVTRHGKTVRVKRTRWERVVVLPHVVASTRRRVAYGEGTTVNGWLGTSTGTAVAGQPVTIYTAPDNGLGRFTPAATTVTAANGGWSASIGAGPSRLVEAVYGGSATLEPASSGSVHVIVPARVRLLSVTPRRVAWGGKVHIVGRLEGGYLPPGGALVRLRIGTGSAHTTYGVKEHVGGNGRFATTYTFGAGLPNVHESFWFQIASLPMGSYPYAPANSGRRYVVVGGHPPPPPRRKTGARSRRPARRG